MKNPCILFRGNEYENQEELAAIRNAGIPIYFSRAEIPAGSSILGRYSVLPYYKELEADLNIAGSTMIVPYRDHCFIANISQYYEALKDFTPKTWMKPEYVPADQPGAFFLKGETNSKKFLFDTHCYAKDRKSIGQTLSRLQEDSLVSTQDIIVRQFIPLKTFMTSFHALPITEEYRVFVFNGVVVGSGYYWASHTEDLPASSNVSTDNIPKDWLNSAIAAVTPHVRSFVIDVARTESNDWIVIELNDFQMSGLSDVSPETLYLNLAKQLNNM